MQERHASGVPLTDSTNRLRGKLGCFLKTLSVQEQLAYCAGSAASTWGAALPPTPDGSQRSNLITYGRRNKINKNVSIKKIFLPLLLLTFTLISFVHRKKERHMIMFMSFYFAAICYGLLFPKDTWRSTGVKGKKFLRNISCQRFAARDMNLSTTILRLHDYEWLLIYQSLMKKV